MNTVRTTLLVAGLTALRVWAGDLIGGRQRAVVALIFAGAMNFFSYWYSDRIVTAMYGAKEIGPEEDAELYGLVQDLTQHAALLMPRVFIIPQQTPNAFATGRTPQHAAVAVTQAIRRILTKHDYSDGCRPLPRVRCR